MPLIITHPNPNFGDTIDDLSEPTDPPGLIVRTMADIEPKPVRWLWHHKFVRGALNMLIGMPDVGKSLLTADLASRISTGMNWPPIDGERADNEQGDVMFLSAEDCPDDTTVPRLNAAGANGDRIHFIEATNRVDDKGNAQRTAVDISRDIERIEQWRREKCPDLRLLIIDPLDSYIGGKTDTNSGNKSRDALWPLQDWAMRTGVTVLIVHHFNKSATTNALDKVSGARSFAAICRTVWCVGRDPQDESKIVMLPAKSNLVSLENRAGMAYTIKSSMLDPEVPCITWLDELVDVTTMELIEGKRSTALSEAVDWVRQTLAAGPMTAADLKDEADENGPTWASVKRAKKELGIKSEPINDPDTGRRTGWLWALPPHIIIELVEYVELVD